MRTQISKVAKSLNVGVNTAVEFLRKHNIEVDEGNPNARIDSDAVELLTREFSKDKDAKANAEAFIKNRREEKKRRADATRPKRSRRRRLASRYWARSTSPTERATSRHLRAQLSIIPRKRLVSPSPQRSRLSRNPQ